uniref:HAT C-terminal dimerisation domain-containing protein n=1 Tax=Sphaeramia orbicularis TaxID=375764 RepID=A0A673B110_9TELE
MMKRSYPSGFAKRLKKKEEEKRQRHSGKYEVNHCVLQIGHNCGICLKEITILFKIVKEHEYTKAHSESMKKWHDLHKRLLAKTAIDQTYQDLMQLEIEDQKAVIHRVIAIICHLAEQNQALRGTSDVPFDNHSGNFLPLVKLMGQFDSVLNEHLKRIKNKEMKEHYLSPTIQNEIINLVGEKIIEEIMRRVKLAKYYAVIMDCTPDVSHKEQLSLVLRTLNCETSVGASISEHFVGFFDVEDTTGGGLTETLLEYLQQHGNMMGHKQGVQARILQITAKLFVYAAKSSVMSMSFFGLLQRLYNLFSSSVQRWAVLRQHVTQLTLKMLSTIRWEARIDSVKVLRYHLPQVLEALSALQTVAAEKRDAETLSIAKCLYSEMNSWRFLLCTIVWYNVLYQINHMSKLLQSPNVSLKTLRRETEGVRGYLMQFRESGLSFCQSDAMNIAEELKIEKRLPAKRQKRTPKHFNCDSAAEETFHSPEEAFRREFFLPLVDTALTSLNDRFSKMEDVYALYSFLFSKDNMRRAVIEDKLQVNCTTLEKTLHDTEAEDLVLEVRSAIHTFPDHVFTCPQDMLNYIYSEGLLDLYSNLSIALCLLLTLPVIVASGQRSFSALKHIKSYLRSSMSQERLRGLALISTERNVRKSLNMEDVVTAFVRAKVRKRF